MSLVNKNYQYEEYFSDPFVGVYENIISSEECSHFISLAKNNLKRSLVSEEKKGIISDGRTGRNLWIDHNHDNITKKVGERIAEIVGIPLENAESFQIIHYGEEQEYRNHYDSWVHDYSEKTLRCMKWGGARLKTALCYLNSVTEGGGTKMTKLNKIIQAKKGRMLVFENTYKDNHNRHPLSEHAGMPVIIGEKYAFNLWFKEYNSKQLYSLYNPAYYDMKIPKMENIPINTNNSNIKWNYSAITVPQLNNYKNILNSLKGIPNIIKLHKSKEIFKINSYINTDVSKEILNKCKFNTKERRDCWLQLSENPLLIKTIEDTIGIDQSFFENINVVEYKENIVHNKHFNAYDLYSDIGKKHTKILGQRIFTISLLLSDNISMDYPRMNFDFKNGDILIYKNVVENTLIRDNEMQRSIKCNHGNGYLANIYIRNKNKNGEELIKTYVENKSEYNTESKYENYIETLDIVFDKFKNNKIIKNWEGFKSFKYIFKGNFDKFKQYINEYNTIRLTSNNKSCLNNNNLIVDYDLNDKLPIQIVNNVLDKKLLDLLQKYYKETILDQVWELGDRQSKRYKSHNEPMSRFLHYEFLPLIEKITGRSLKPTYTYLSAYIKGADLPPHTDREDCEYTVSFIVDKPENFNWNIYIHKLQQNVKHKGRYDKKPPLEECVPVDCDVGGLMLFQGTDHIHFREKLEGDYYNILLLHYR